MKVRGHNTDPPPPWQVRSQRTLAGDYLHHHAHHHAHQHAHQHAHLYQPILRSEGGGSGSGLRKFESRASLNTTGTNESPAMASKFGSSFTVNKHKKVLIHTEL